LDIVLHPEERRCLGNADDKRTREFVTGRACARFALAKLGLPATAIGHGPGSEPLWPSGVVGSLTHCAGFRACAVARSADAWSLGIDAEPNAPLPSVVLSDVIFGHERGLPHVAGGVHLDRLIFSAKEAVYKAWYPLTRRWLSFGDVSVSLDLPEETFSAHVLVPDQPRGGSAELELHGRWSMVNDVICTSLVLLPGNVRTGPGQMSSRRPVRDPTKRP
jgi:4'-phosphopantetheinyl transferase EntD